MSRRKIRHLSPGACRAILFTRKAMISGALGLLFAFIVGSLGSIFRDQTEGVWKVAAFVLGMVCVGAIALSFAASIAIVAFFCARYTIVQMLAVILLINIFGTVAVLGGDTLRVYAILSLAVLSIAVICFVLTQYPTKREIDAALKGENVI